MTGERIETSPKHRPGKIETVYVSFIVCEPKDDVKHKSRVTP